MPAAPQPLNKKTDNIARIKAILESKNYKPNKYNIFLIREPKIRLIMAQSITDKIINHLIKGVKGHE